jgi:hypothetical protein
MTDVRTSLHPFYLTFGVQYEYQEHPYWKGADPAGWVRIMAKTHDAAIALARAYFGERYAFLYPADHFNADEDRKYYPHGELAVIEQGNLTVEGDGPKPIVTTSEPELYGVAQDATVAVRIEGILKENPGVDPDVELFHRTCVERGTELFARIDERDNNVQAFELDWSVPNECPVCGVSIT